MPRTPDTEAYRFWRLDDEWWVAYQDGRRYLQQVGRGAAATTPAGCRTGTTVRTHGDGLAFIEGGTTRTD